MKNIFLLLLMLASTGLFAQNNYEDVVYLKNGSIVHGMLIEQVPNVSLKIQTRDGNIFAYQLSEIAKITREPVGPERAQDTFNFNNTLKRGVVVEIQIGGLFGFGYTTTPPNMPGYGNGKNNFCQLKAAFLGRLLPNLFLGGGTAIEVAPNNTIIYNSGNQDLMFPFFAEVKYCFLKKRVSPFLSQDAGYAFYVIAPQSESIMHTVVGGAMLQTQAGVKFFAKPKLALNMSLGYRFQHLHAPASVFNNDYYYYYPYPPNQSSYNIFTHYMTLSWGLSF